MQQINFYYFLQNFVVFIFFFILRWQVFSGCFYSFQQYCLCVILEEEVCKTVWSGSAQWLHFSPSVGFSVEMKYRIAIVNVRFISSSRSMHLMSKATWGKHRHSLFILHLSWFVFGFVSNTESEHVVSITWCLILDCYFVMRFHCQMHSLYY